MTGAEFYHLRKQVLKLSARQLAAILGVHPRTIYKWEHEELRYQKAIPRMAEHIITQLVQDKGA
jgi:DNA-binding transcriptional regulator YiaG